MISIDINEREVKQLYLEKLQEKIKEVDVELLFWDRKELERRTCMSWDTIQKQFLHDPRFPKHKVGAKWYFPAREASHFLITWIKERA
ncbi:group-specific protein [Metabacillus idriensis]|uniref:group-specific protein n=1 Tax=Metabacillus idriensis TaxID=324768 RepID=UPI00174C295A|nr:group-specific protein [Metabacillus idriensis]